MPSALQIPAPVRKSTQALNYFAHKSASGAPARRLNRMKALKLLFFADRYHLRKYGRPVSDCAYFAMKHGPVASEAKHVAEESARLDNRSRSYARANSACAISRIITPSGKSRPPNFAVMVASALECITRIFSPSQMLVTILAMNSRRKTAPLRSIFSAIAKPLTRAGVEPCPVKGST